MSEWKEYKLGEVVTWGNGKERPKDKGTIPVYGGNGVLDYTNRGNYDGETVIVGRVGAYCGSVFYTNQPIWVSDNALAAKPQNGNDAKFLYYFLRHLNLNGYAEGSTHPLVTQRLLNSIDVFIPSLDEQKRIAGVLSSLDDKIDLLNRENATLEALAETLFHHYFIENPNPTWKEGKLTDFIKIIGGGTPKTSEPSYWNGNIGWLSGGDISVNHKNYILNVEKYITQKGVNNSAVNVLPESSMIISARGTVGKYCLLGRPMAFSQSNYGILPKINDCYYFTYLLVSKYVEEMKNAAYGSVFDTITTKTFESIDVVMPNDEEKIVEFNDQVKPFFEKLKTNKLQIQTLSSQRDALLPRLMSGEVKIVAE